MEVVFKNVFLRGAIKSVERHRGGEAAPTDLGPGAPNKLWEVVIEGAEYEAKVSVRYSSLMKWLKGTFFLGIFQTEGGCQWSGCCCSD